MNLRAWIVIIMCLAGGIIVWDAYNEGFAQIYTNLETNYPTYYADSGFTFFKSFTTWIPVVLILVSIVIYSVRQSQKPYGGVIG